MCTGNYDHYFCGHSNLAWTNMCSLALVNTSPNAPTVCTWVSDVASMSRTKCADCRERDGLKRKRDEEEQKNKGGDAQDGGRNGKLRKVQAGAAAWR